MTDEAPTHPTPAPSALTQPWWDAAKERRLTVQHCIACDRLIFYPREFCPSCLSSELEWREMSGKGHVHTYTVIRQAAHPYFQEHVPYLYGVVKLVEGPQMFTNFLMDLDAIEIGQPVEAVFTDISDEYAIVQWKPSPRATP